MSDTVYFRKLRLQLCSSSRQCHKSHQSMNTLIDNGLIIQSAPPYSPDLNPIELMWSDMKTFFCKKFCETVDDVEKAVGDYAKTIAVEKCTIFINNLNQVLILKQSLKFDIFNIKNTI